MNDELVPIWVFFTLMAWSVCFWNCGDFDFGKLKCAKIVGLMCLLIYIVGNIVLWHADGVSRYLITQNVTYIVIAGLFGGVGIWALFYLEKYERFWKVALWVMDVILFMMCILVWI